MSHKKKFLLVSANRYTDPYPVYPIGVSYLKTYLSKKLPHYDIAVFDFNIGSYEVLSNYLKDNNPDYVGISLRNIDGANSFDRSSFINGYKDIIDLVRSIINVPIIIGGAGVSIYPKSLFDEDRKSTRLNSSHIQISRMTSSA